MTERNEDRMSVILRLKNMRGKTSTVFVEGAGKRGRKRVNSQTGIKYWATLIHTTKRLKKLAKKNRRVRKRERAFYVGYSAHSADCRLRQHKWDKETDPDFVCDCETAPVGHRKDLGCDLVKQFGIGLRSEFYDGLIPAYSHVDAGQLERIVAKHLQKQNFAGYSDAIPNIKRKTSKKAW